MLFRSAFLLLSLLLFVLFIQCESLNSISSTNSKGGKYPFLPDDEASQWLSTRNLPRRWHHNHQQHQSSNEIDQTLKQLQALNDNGVRQYDSQSFEGVSMEVIFEMVHKHHHHHHHHSG